MVFHRTPQRLRRRAVGKQLIEAGAPVVTDVYPEGLVWHEGPDARSAWAEIAPLLVTGARPSPRDLQWVGHIWKSDAGEVMLRFDGEH
ncbi:hypothetical protein VV02_17055 [Luteipulveratus mongoliensis]|uniref:Uncharacterized protein n=1 Tax=Luteipulveratus mongoliensis TaxID=571913 RepID=A0A0K1JKQ9_9MICO|nr:hypothetical protein VV02_17055 [Luteipulveratus mongoliensis]